MCFLEVLENEGITKIELVDHPGPCIWSGGIFSSLTVLQPPPENSESAFTTSGVIVVVEALLNL